MNPSWVRVDSCPVSVPDPLLPVPIVIHIEGEVSVTLPVPYSTLKYKLLLESLQISYPTAVLIVAPRVMVVQLICPVSAVCTMPQAAALPLNSLPQLRNPASED